MSAESDARMLARLRQWRRALQSLSIFELSPEEFDLLLRIADERDKLRRDLCTEPEPVTVTVTDPWEESQSTPDTRTITADMNVIRAEYAPVVGALQLAHWDRHGYTNHLGSAAGRSFRDGAWAGIRLVLDRQHAIDDLTTGQLLTELRKGNGSIYGPVLVDKIPADCPRCNRMVNIDAEGVCPTDGCQYEFQEVD